MSETALTLFAIGAFLEVAGLAMAAIGFRRTWMDFRTEGGRVFDPQVEWMRAIFQRARTLASRMRNHTHPAAPSDADVGATVFGAHIKGGFDPLPSLSSDPKSFAEEVERRINEVYRYSIDLRQYTREEIEKQTSTQEEVRAELATRIDNVEGISRSIAIGGLGEQIIGWSCISLGFVLQSISTVIQTATS